jgi:hypothetical protein
MIGIPTFLSNDAVVIKHTPNGYAVCESVSSPVEQCPVFETWDALVYYLASHFQPVDQA